MTEQKNAVLLNRRSGGVTEVVLNRPDKRNAFDDVIIQQLINALETVNTDDSTSVVILRSEGKHFSAGADLGWMRRLIPAVISPYVVRAIGERQARRYFISAEVFTARQAEHYGLVHEVCDDVEAMERRCNELLLQLALNGPEAMKAAKELVFAVSQKVIGNDVIDDTAQRIADIRVGAEGQEGLSAFLNKRKANWVPEED